jgi:alkylated DNA repair dioxygenase AlkB
MIFLFARASVVSLTLQAGCAMDFKHKDSKHQTQVYLERRSLLVLEVRGVHPLCTAAAQ